MDFTVANALNALDRARRVQVMPWAGSGDLQRATIAKLDAIEEAMRPLAVGVGRLIAESPR